MNHNNCSVRLQFHQRRAGWLATLAGLAPGDIWRPESEHRRVSMSGGATSTSLGPPVGCLIPHWCAMPLPMAQPVAGRRHRCGGPPKTDSRCLVAEQANFRRGKFAETSRQFHRCSRVKIASCGRPRKRGHLFARVNKASGPN